MIIVGCSNTERIAKAVAEKLGAKLGDSELIKFPDKELKFKLIEEPKEKHVVIIQSGQPKPTRSVFEVCMAADVAGYYGAKDITAVFMYLPYARQDKRFDNRRDENSNEGFQPLTLELVLKMLEMSGVKKLILFDVHNEASVRKIKVPKMKIVNIPLGEQLVNYIKKKKKVERPIIVAPDNGAKTRAKEIADSTDCGMTMLKKNRINSETVIMEGWEGEDPKGQVCIIVDDLISTGGTLLAAAKYLKEQGAENVYAAATHGVFSKNAIKRLTDKEEGLDWCIVTDSIGTELSEELMIEEIVKALK